MKSLKKILQLHSRNYKGKRINDKVVIFESDDWGSIRTTSPCSYKNFQNSFNTVDNPYLKYDTLASSNDLNALFEVLRQFKDRAGNHPVITFNTVVGNPDFEKIKALKYEEYHYEPFTSTLKRYYPTEEVFNLWQEGINDDLIYPQFHGREHVNVPVWLEQLRSGNNELLKAFELGTWSTPKGKYPPDNVKLQAALDYKGEQPLGYQKRFIREGLDLFEEIFGFRSQTMIANNFILSENLHPAIKESGIKLLQGMKYQVLPYGNNSKHIYKRRYFGQKDSNGLFLNVRNCTFEPSQSKSGYDDVGNCLKQIQNAFFWKKPAVITTHRLNYIGAVDENNRRRNLMSLSILLSSIKKKWPDVVFLSSDKVSTVFDNK